MSLQEDCGSCNAGLKFFALCVASIVLLYLFSALKLKKTA